MLTDIIQSGPCTFSHGNVWLLLLRLHQSYRLYNLVWDPDLLRWQSTLGDASLHLRQQLEGLWKHTSCQRKRKLEAAVDFLHGVASRVPFRK